MKPIRLLFSIQLTVFLFAVFAFSFGVATFVEDAHGTETARALIYNARWLEIFYILFVLNLTGMYFRYQMWRKGKQLVGIFHLSFVLILTGSAVTRYLGDRGLLHFREGETSQQYLTDKAFIKVDIDGPESQKTVSFPLMLSTVSPNRWKKSIKTGTGPLKVRLKKFLPEAVPVVVHDSEGIPALTLTIRGQGATPVPLILRQGDRETIENVCFTFDSQAVADSGSSGIYFTLDGNRLLIRSDDRLSVISMREGSRFVLEPDQSIPVQSGMLLNTDRLQFALQHFTLHGRISAEAVENHNPKTDPYSAIILNVSQYGFACDVALFGGTGIEGVPEKRTFGNRTMTFSFGSLPVKLPFSLQLNDFIIERYPGSRMPSTYESQVTLKDRDNSVHKSCRIYMNHILKYRGYRFYQTSYDEDERGSVLSVSRDPGTPVTYAGYALLIICLVLNFLNPDSRFRQLGRQIQKMAVLLLMGIVFLCPSKISARSLSLPQLSISRSHANRFAKLTVQDSRGRMKPLNSLAHQLIRDLGHPEKSQHWTPNQWILFVYAYSDSLDQYPAIPLEDPVIRRELNWTSSPALAPPSIFFDSNGHYILERRTQSAESQPKHARSERDKALIRIRERLNIIHSIQDLFRLHPVSAQSSHWVSDGDTRLDSTVRNQIGNYKKAVRLKQWSEADVLLQKIRSRQQALGGTVLPPPIRQQVEIFYNEARLFERLFPPLLIAGILLLFCLIMNMIKPQIYIRTATKLLTGLIFTGFVCQTGGLILRWIASGHAPWTNKYESMIYIAWAIMLAGVLFLKNSRFPLSLAAMFSASILGAAHLPWTDPAITNLVPVLKSHWLITHVSIITASYGFFALSALLGLLTLIFVSVLRKGDPAGPHIQILSMINERAMLIGLTLVMIGNLLGAVWANESWGRYWGWDPKETWTLIVILVYTAILHIRLIPRVDNGLAVSIGSTFAFWAVMMTYIGVNFYLSGMHSYAAGEAPPVPPAIYLIIGIQVLLTLVSIIKRK